MHLRKGFILAAGAVALFAAGCGTLRNDRNDPFRDSQMGGTYLIVLVDNLNREDVQVEMVRPGSREDLGTVSARSRGRFPVEWNQRQEVQFQINLVAGARHRVRGRPVSPGDMVELVVTDPITSSVVRRR